MGFNDHMDFDLLERIQELLDRGYFEKGTPEHGIALKAAQEGEASLSPAQLAIWRRVQREILPIPISEEEEFLDALDADREMEMREL